MLGSSCSEPALFTMWIIIALPWIALKIQDNKCKVLAQCLTQRNHDFAGIIKNPSNAVLHHVLYVCCPFNSKQETQGLNFSGPTSNVTDKPNQEATPIMDEKCSDREIKGCYKIQIHMYNIEVKNLDSVISWSWFAITVSVILHKVSHQGNKKHNSDYLEGFS